MDLQRQVNVENVDNLIQLCFSAVAKEDTDPKTTHEIAIFAAITIT